jgi:hypothetical protein
MYFYGTTFVGVKVATCIMISKGNGEYTVHYIMSICNENTQL